MSEWLVIREPDKAAAAAAAQFSWVLFDACTWNTSTEPKEDQDRMGEKGDDQIETKSYKTDEPIRNIKPS